MSGLGENPPAAFGADGCAPARARESSTPPASARDAMRRAPVAALLILLSLIAGPGPVSGAGSALRDPLTRLAPARSAAGTGVVSARPRDGGSDETSDPHAAPSLLPPGPRILVKSLSATPLPLLGPKASAKPANIAAAPYRARAPPAA